MFQLRRPTVGATVVVILAGAVALASATPATAVESAGHWQGVNTPVAELSAEINAVLGSTARVESPDTISSPSVDAAGASVSEVTLANQPDWVQRINVIRKQFNVPPVVEDPELSRTAALHSNYMALNKGIGHSEEQGKPGYTPEGHTAAQQSNVAMQWGKATAVDFIDQWAMAPFHAIGMLRPQLTRVGFAQASDGEYLYGTLNVLKALDGQYPSAGWPRLFPNGPGVDYLAYSGNEWPDPATPCGGGNNYGTPIIADFGDRAKISSATTELFEDGKKLDVCTTLAKDFGENAWALDQSRVLVMPRTTLKKGAKYTGTVKTDIGTATINFDTILGAQPKPQPTPTATTVKPKPTPNPTINPNPTATATPTLTPDLRAKTTLTAKAVTNLGAQGKTISMEATVTSPVTLPRGIVLLWARKPGGKWEYVDVEKFPAGGNSATVVLTHTYSEPMEYVATFSSTDTHQPSRGPIIKAN